MKVSSVSEVTISMSGDEASRMSMRLRAIANRCCNDRPRYSSSLAAWGCDTCLPIREYAIAIEGRDQ